MWVVAVCAVCHGTTVNAITWPALGRVVLSPVYADALGQLAQRCGPCPFRREQIADYGAREGLMADPVRRHSLGGQQQREGLLLLAQVRVRAGPVSQVPAAGSQR